MGARHTLNANRQWHTPASGKIDRRPYLRMHVCVAPMHAHITDVRARTDTRGAERSFGKIIYRGNLMNCCKLASCSASLRIGKGSKPASCHEASGATRRSVQGLERLEKAEDAESRLESLQQVCASTDRMADARLIRQFDDPISGTNI